MLQLGAHVDALLLLGNEEALARQLQNFHVLAVCQHLESNAFGKNRAEGLARVDSDLAVHGL